MPFFPFFQGLTFFLKSTIFYQGGLPTSNNGRAEEPGGCFSLRGRKVTLKFEVSVICFYMKMTQVVIYDSLLI